MGSIFFVYIRVPDDHMKKLLISSLAACLLLPASFVNGQFRQPSHDSTGNTKTKLIYRGFVSLGVISTSLKFEGSPGALSGIYFNQPVSGVFSTGVDVTGKPNRGSLGLEMDLWKASFTGHHNDHQGNSYTYNITQANIGIGLRIQFTLYHKENFMAYVGATLMMNISSYPTNRIDADSLNGSYAAFGPLNMESFWFQERFRAGVQLYQRWNIEAHYDLAGYISNDNGYKASPEQFGLTVGYYLRGMR